MQQNRRSFVAKVLGGIGMVVGMLMPARASALRRRRDCCLPANPCPRSGAAWISFPDEPDVHGGGGLYAWGGRRDAQVTINSVSCSGGTLTAVNPPAPGSVWARRIDGLTLGQFVTLTVNYTDSSITPPETTTVTATFRAIS